MRIVEWGLGLLEWTAAEEEMTPRHYLLMVTTVTVLVVPPVIVLRWIWSGMAPVYKETLTEIGKLALAVPKWTWRKVAAAASWTARRLAAKARDSRSKIELAITTTASALSSVAAIATSGQSTPLLTSDADDTAVDVSVGCFDPQTQQARVTRDEIAAVMQDLNKRAQEFNAERKASMNEAMKAKNETHSTLNALNTARIASSQKRAMVTTRTRQLTSEQRQCHYAHKQSATTSMSASKECQ